MFAVIKIIVYLAGFFISLGAVYNSIGDKNRQIVANWLANWTHAGFDAAIPLLNGLEAALGPLAAAFVAAFNQYGGPIATDIQSAIAPIIRTGLDTSANGLTASGESTPDNALEMAAAALVDAFGFGIGSAGATAAFEAVFPEKLNVLNGVGPMLAQMAGFDEVQANVRGPLYENAFGKSLDYHFRSLFKPELPNEADAITWHARRLLTDAQLSTIFNYSGLKPEYEAPFITSAYRPVPPFLLARAAEAGAIPVAQLTGALQFAGFRDVDITMLETAYAYLAILPYINQYITAAVRSTELGTMTPAELGQSLTQANIPQEAQTWIQLTVATRKLEQLAELYRKSISEGYRYGTITDAQYVPSLEAIGIGAADAQAHYAVDSIAKTGKAAVAAVKAAERLAAQRTRAEGKAAIQGFRSGTLDAVALEAALIAAGYDPVVAGFAVTYETLKQTGVEVYVYGVELPRSQALVLREQVSALGIQVRAQLVTPAAALAALAGYGVPAANAQALVADWAATHTPTGDVGVLEPR